MPKKGCVERVAKSLISPKEKLNPLFFDENDVMHEEIKESLKRFVQIYIDNIYSKFEDLIISDICLVGSQASYFYHDQSDLDIVVKTQGENNKYLTDELYKFFNHYVSNVFLPHLPDGTLCKWRGIKADISPLRFIHKYSPQYSILHNEWVCKFDKILLQDISVPKIAEAFYNKLIEFSQTLQKIIGDSDLSAKEKNDKLYEYYRTYVYDMRNNVYLDNLVYKLFRSQNHIQSLGIMVAVNNLSIINNMTGSRSGISLETPEDTARRLLTPNKTLSEFIFNSDGQIHETLRQKLIAAAKIVFEQTAGKFEGTKIKDIRLIGSMAGYTYKANSDLDITIIVDFTDCPYINLHDDVQAINYLTELYAAAVDILPQFKINGKTVDITLKTKYPQTSYSVLQNKWIKEPQRDYFSAKSPQEMAVKYYQELEKYAAFMRSIEIEADKYKLEDCKKVQKYIIRRMNTDNYDNPEAHFIFTMLSQQGLMQLFNSNMVDSLNYTLSLEKTAS